jgi:hypothetical protein
MQKETRKNTMGRSFSVVIQYFTRYGGGDPNQPYRVDYSGHFSTGCYTRHVGDESISLYRYLESEEGRKFEWLNADGVWEDSDTIRRYIYLGSSDTVDEIDLQEAKRIAILRGFPNAVT